MEVIEYQGRMYRPILSAYPKVGDLVLDSITNKIDKVLWVEYNAVWLDKIEEDNGARYMNEVTVLREIQ